MTSWLNKLNKVIKVHVYYKANHGHFTLKNISVSSRSQHCSISLDHWKLNTKTNKLYIYNIRKQEKI